MEALEKYRLSIKIAEYIENNLEPLARAVEDAEGADNAASVCYSQLRNYIKEAYPEAVDTKMARILISDECRRQYLKLIHDQKARNYAHGK
jgi:hypothetical protein